MAITQTALTADLAADALTMKVSSGTGFPTAGDSTPQRYLCRIDKEYFLAVTQPVSGVIKIAQRGYQGTVATAHDTLAKVSVSSNPADFADASPGNSVPLPPYLPAQQTIGEDRTFTSTEVAAWGNQPQDFVITKATAAAITLPAPSTAQDGLMVTFTSLTAAAHVITATNLINNGVTGSPHDTATLAAFAGSGCVFKAQGGLWNLVSSVVVTVASV